jgi:predicted AlkP superfamily pyrophosphatase or phosphodiesterase
MKTARLLLIFACVAVCLLDPLAPTRAVAQQASTEQATTQSLPGRPIAAIDHVLIISIDGCRPDLLLRADTPVVHRLMRQGSFTFWAKTTAVAVTLPSHVSMLTGCTPSKHFIEWNRDLPLSQPVYPNVPTIFELAHQAGYSTAMAAGKNKFQVLNKPGTLDWVWISPIVPPMDATTDPTAPATTDAEVAEHAVDIIQAHKPQVMFVHLPSVDVVGHRDGWATDQQIAAIEQADAAIGKVLDAWRATGIMDHTLLIVTSDHGGAGKTHGPDDPRSRYVPWIVVGPTVRPNFDLTTIAPLEVQTYDTFATACWVLGLHPNPTIDGKPIREIFQQQELMEAAPTPAAATTRSAGM